MEQSKHSEFIRRVDGASVAVLCIHGILGSPNHFRELIPLIPEGYSVHNMVLDGHCGSVGDFSRSSMKKWRAQVHGAVEDLLADHGEILILAHSMGTLLAIEEAITEPRITGIFCLSIPIKVGFRYRMLSTMMKMYFGTLKPEDTLAYAARECTGLQMTKNPFAYLGLIPRYLELFSEIRRVRRLLPSLTTPCHSFQSGRDELVSPRSFDILRAEAPSIKVEMLEGSTHFYYPPPELEHIKDQFLLFLSRNTDQ